MRTQTIGRINRQRRTLVPLMLACAASLTAQVTLEPRIVSETLPSGSIMQVKLQLTTPNPIITGNARFEMSSSFDSFQGVSAFSPAGDAYGVALISGGIFSANLVSPLVSLGTQLDYPFLVAALHIRAGLPNGTLVPINFSPTTIFNGPGGSLQMPETDGVWPSWKTPADHARVTRCFP